MDAFVHDLRMATRALRNRPGLAVVSIFALAVGIGANAAIFGVVKGVLGPLPYPGAERIVALYEDREGDGTGMMSLAPAELLALDADERTFEQVAAWSPGSVTVTGEPHAETVTATNLTHDFLDLLGDSLERGRDFTESDVEAGTPVTLVGWELWHRRWGADPDLLGSEIVLDGEAHTVIGITGRDVGRLGGTDRLFLPLRFTPEQEISVSWHNFRALARHREGIDPAVLRERVAAVAGEAQEALGHDDEDPRTVYPTPLYDQWVGGFRRPLSLLMGAVGLLAVIACSNVANLQLARTLARRRELAMRLALGSGRGRLMRQLLAESCLLALLGGIAGLALAGLSMSGLRALVAHHLPRVDSIHLDPGVLAFALGLSLVAGLAVGGAPAWLMSRHRLTGTLQETSGLVVGSRSESWLRRGLVVAQVGLAVVLAVGAGLLLRSFSHLSAVDLGFDATAVVTSSLRVSSTSDFGETPELIGVFHDRLLDRLEGFPEIDRAALTNLLPGTGGRISSGVRLGQGSDEPVDAGIRVVSPGYLQVLDIPVLEGRPLSEDDESVALVNREFVRRHWPDADPLGQRIEVMGFWGIEGSFTVVGVVEDVKLTTLAPLVFPDVYLSSRNAPLPYMNVVMSTDASPGLVGERLRTVVAEIDPGQPVGTTRSLDEAVSNTFAQQRVNAVLLTLFAAIALVLAGVGEYAVIQYMVRQRTGEIGVRMALGARPGDVLAMVLRQGLGLVAAGIVVGLAGAWTASRLLASMLHGIAPNDPLTYLAVTGFLALVAAAACVVPARAATRVDPARTLRDP